MHSAVCRKNQDIDHCLTESLIRRADEPTQRPRRSTKDNIIDRAYSVLMIYYVQVTAQRMRMLQRRHVYCKVIRAGCTCGKGGMTGSKDPDDSAAARDRSQYEAQGWSALPETNAMRSLALTRTN